MKRIAGFVLLCALAAVPAGAATRPYFKASGTVSTPNPATKVTGGVTERFTPCKRVNPQVGDRNGFDASWVKLRDGSALRSATMTSTAIDMDVWFYDEACDVIVRSEDERANGWATLNTPGERGKVPEAAVWVAVAMAAGRDATFELVVK